MCELSVKKARKGAFRWLRPADADFCAPLLTYRWRGNPSYQRYFYIRF